MPLLNAIRDRRTVRKFSDHPITRADIEPLLAAAVLAPNHRLTHPWRFHVLGPDARYAYGVALGNRKAKKIEDPAAADAIREKIGAEHRALPAMIVVGTIENENPEIREEDYAAVMMAVQNLTLAAVDAGFGTAIRSGAIMGDPAARAAAQASDGERIIAVIHLGAPSEDGERKPREGADAYTNWLP